MINFVIFRLRGYFLKIWIRKRVLNSVIGADKAERLVAEAAGKGAEVVVFPEAFVGGYPQGSSLGVAVANTSEKGKQDFQRYHASAIDVPGELVFTTCIHGSTLWCRLSNSNNVCKSML